MTKQKKGGKNMVPAEETENALAARVLGLLVLPKATGGFKAEKEALLQPLHEDGVVRSFCSGCGTCLEIHEKGAAVLAKMAKAEVPASWEGCYFETKRCQICADDYEGVVLKAI
jgi:ferredoxin